VGADSKISWTDHTFNPWEGCTKVSPGCLHCYAETRNARFGGGEAPNWGAGKPRRRTSRENWLLPVRWNKMFEGCHYSATRPVREMDAFGWRPHRARIFCASLADWLDDEVPIAWLADLLALIHATPNLDWQLLTKRPEKFWLRIEAASDHHFDNGDRNVAGWLHDWRKHGIAPRNVWIGTSAEDQKRYDDRIPVLCAIPAVIHFVSFEPLLGPIELRGPKFGWGIIGGESGHEARPCNMDWIQDLILELRQINAEVFVKQLGSRAFSNTALPMGTGHSKNLNMDVPPRWEYHPHFADTKGAIPEEWPVNFQIQEFPR
jgi:protein gp37